MMKYCAVNKNDVDSFLNRSLSYIQHNVCIKALLSVKSYKYVVTPVKPQCPDTERYLGYLGV